MFSHCDITFSPFIALTSPTSETHCCNLWGSKRDSIKHRGDRKTEGKDGGGRDKKTKSLLRLRWFMVHPHSNYTFVQWKLGTSQKIQLKEKNTGFREDFQHYQFTHSPGSRLKPFSAALCFPLFLQSLHGLGEMLLYLLSTTQCELSLR